MAHTVLILGGTGKTGRHLVATLRSAGADVRTAARSGADARFDWDDPATHDAALAGVDRVYLVPPALRLDHAPIVAGFLERAGAAGVRHTTLLSAFGVQYAPAESPLRAVELAVIGGPVPSWSILRPAWFMQNFTEGAFVPLVERGTLTLPAGDGAEAFIDTSDIAAAAAATLRDPAGHAGAEYDLTGPEALTLAEVARLLSDGLGRPVGYSPVPVPEFTAALISGGIPADYAGLLAGLLELISVGQGSRPTTGVADATGREPRTFAAVLAEAAGRPATTWVS